MRFPGGKNAAGTYQRIISQIPPHRVYVEPFVGSGAVLRYKLPADRSVAADLDPGAIAALAGAVPAGTRLLLVNGVDLLEAWDWRGDEFVYCDPPYLQSVCKSPLAYRHVLTAKGHERLLGVLRGLPCPVMLSGYDSPLYRRLVGQWRQDRFEVVTRGGTKATEVLWMNYPEPVELHDYRYLGRDYRERENYRKMERRWAAKLATMDPMRRLALFAALKKYSTAGNGEPRADRKAG